MSDKEKLAAVLARLFARHDPVGLIAVGAPQDEYLLEAHTLCEDLPHCATAQAVRARLYAIMLRWFGGDHDRIGPEDHYTSLADDIWTAWQQWRVDHA